MSNPPTIITNPTPLIKNQPGTITYYIDVSENFDMDTSQNTFPAPDSFYFLQNESSEQVGSAFYAYPYNEDLSSNFQSQVTTLFSRPTACAFDTNGYLYISDLSVNIITAFNPNFYQTNNYAYMYTPFGVKFNPINGNLYVTCLLGNDASTPGSIITLTPNYNSSLNPSGVDFKYNDFFDTNGNFEANGNIAPKTNYCYVPYDIVFGNSGNVFISNFGYYPGFTQVDGFISKLFINNGIVTDAAVVISKTSPSGGTTTTLGGTSTGCYQDLDFSYPSGMAFDSSNNYLYVANSYYGNGQITMYELTSTSITKLAVLETGKVGNKRAFNISGGHPITALQLDNYGNLYYIYDNDRINPLNSKTTINALSISVDNSNVVAANLIYSHEIMNINTKYNSYFNYAYGFSFNNGNIFLTANISQTGASRGGGIIEIQNAFTFTDVSLNSGTNTLSLLPVSFLPPVSFEIQVPESHTLVSNAVPYTKQSSILTYYDNINSANNLVPTSNYTYNLVDAATDSIVNTTKVIKNNEIIYCPFSNELGSLNYPVSMDFDASGNLYVLNSPQNGVIFLTIITPNSGNFQKQYKPSLTITYPTAIRYNKYDNCMYITSFDINLYGTIFRIQTEIINNPANLKEIDFKITTTFFYQNLVGNDYCHCPMDLVFDNNSSLYISCAGSLKVASGYEPADWNANITKCDIDYTNGLGKITNIYILVDQNVLGNYISGIEADDNYVYVVSAPDSTQYSGYSATPYGNCYTNISQFDKNTGQLIHRWNAGYVGKLPDVVNNNYFNIYTNNTISTLKFDASYSNLFYITYYDSTNYVQPYYLNTSSDILYNPPTSGSYYVQAFVPTSGSGAPIFTHAMKSNPLQPIYGLALYDGNIFVSQYTKNTIIKLIYVLSFGNFGYGIPGSQSTFIIAKENNSYYITGGNSPVYDIYVNNVKTLGNVFPTATIVTNPNPLLEGKPGTLYYYDNPSTTSPAPNTRYFLVNSNGKVVSNNYISPPGNENTIIYNNLSSPKCMTIDNEGYLYIANYGRTGNYQNGSIVKSTIQGKIVYIKQNINIGNPYAIKYNSKDGYIYYTNTSPNIISGVNYFYIYRMSTDGNTFTQIFQDQSYNYLYNPYDICFDTDGNLYVTNGYTTSASGASINGSIAKITLDYTLGYAFPLKVEVFSNLLTGLPLNSSGNVIVSGIAIDNITKYLYVVSGVNDANGNNINISQIPLTGNDAGYVCRKWQTGMVGNSSGQSALNFDTYGNLYYYSYYPIEKIGLLNAFNPYTNNNSTYSHELLGGAVSGAYGIVYYNGNFYSSQSALNATSGTYIDNVVKINASYFFTGVTLHAGDNVLSINTVIPNQIVIANISVNASAPKYYTIPSPPVAGKPSKLIYEYEGVITPVPGHNYVVVNSSMDFVSGILQNYNPGDEPNPFSFTFENLILPGGSNYLYIFDITLGELVSGSNMLIRVPVICFFKGTKILCLLNGKEIYVPIEKIGEGTMVKTYKRGYRKVKYNVMGKLKNTAEHSIDKLFKLSKKKVPELREDLYVTGGHALLHNSLDESETILMEKVVHHAVHNYNSIYKTKIEDKYKLIAYHDKRFEEVMMNTDFEIYHIVLESENETSNYGIYANGILAESTDDLTIMRMKGFEKINKTSESLYKFVNSMNVKKYPEQVKRALTAKMN